MFADGKFKRPDGKATFSASQWRGPARPVRLFQDHDERSLIESQAFYEDERQLIQSAKQAADEISGLFEADQRQQQQAREAE